MRRDEIAAEIIRCRNELASLKPDARSNTVPLAVKPATASDSTPLAVSIGQKPIDIGSILDILNSKFEEKGYTMRRTTDHDIQWRASGTRVVAAAHITDHTIYLSIYPTNAPTQEFSLHSAADAENVTV